MTIRKTYMTAVVLIPPEEIWEPIQALRRVHDRHFHRWMPHITLLYPFAERGDFPEVTPALGTASAAVQSFSLQFARFDYFRHKRNCTLFLIPEPEARMIHLHSGLARALPAYDDTAKYPDGFHPHLSIGQFQHHQAERVQHRLQTEWTPIQFEVIQISLIHRAPETGDRFVVAEQFPLSRRTTMAQ